MLKIVFTITLMLNLFVCELVWAAYGFEYKKSNLCHKNDGTLTQLSNAVMVAEENLCEPKVGQPVRVDDTIDEIPRKYLLTKLSDKKYEIGLHLGFINFDYWTSNLSQNEKNRTALQTRTDWEPKVFECLSKYSSYLTGPNGEELVFKRDKDAPRKTFVISPVKERPNSSSLPADIDCLTVVHEIMHLLGLVDEYQELAKGYVLDPVSGEYQFVKNKAEILMYDCRAIGQMLSVMGDDKVLKKQIEKNLNHSSILRPAHFRMITSPHCYRKNKRYLECASFARKSSIDYQNKKCDEKSEECKRNQGWLD